ncbi:MAG: hypothetical protein JNN15_17365, partial [Blastocatellia bacterium]|nr:hypothetical protein [Blastocatellia bacterium]
MRSNKRYSNVTYTKRVDHEKSLLAAKPEPEVCRVCGAIYVDRRWTNSQVDPEKIKHQRWNRPTVVTCPACK